MQARYSISATSGGSAKTAFFRFRLAAGGVVIFEQPAQIGRHSVREAGSDAADIDEVVAIARGQQQPAKRVGYGL